MPASGVPSLDPTARRRVARRSLVALGAPTLLVGVTWLLLRESSVGSQATGVLVGHLAMQLVTASWLFGALLTFEASLGRFLIATLGLWPLRIALVVGIVFVSQKLWALHVPSLFLSLLGTLVYGQAVEAWAFTGLSRASRGRTSSLDSPPGEA